MMKLVVTAGFGILLSLLAVPIIGRLFSSDEDGEDEEPVNATVQQVEDDDDTLSEVEERLDELESSTTDLEGMTEDLEQELEKFRGQIDTIEEDVSAVDERTTNLLDMYDAFQARVNPLVDGDIMKIPAHEDEERSTSMAHERHVQEDTTVSNTNQEDSQEAEDGERTHGKDTGLTSTEPTTDSASTGVSEEMTAYEYAQWLSSNYGVSGAEKCIEELAMMRIITDLERKQVASELQSLEETAYENSNDVVIDYEEAIDYANKLSSEHQ